MKLTMIEGTPDELAEYQARTGALGPVQTTTNTREPSEEPLPAGDGQPIGGTGFEDKVMLRSFIYGRAREPMTAGLVENYVQRVLDLGGTEAEIGTSKTSKDGHADYLLIYNAGPRHYGAVAYVSAKNAGLTLRLTQDDVADVHGDPRIRHRDVQSRNEYQINCPVTSADAIDLAVQLTQRALAKVRKDGNSDDKKRNGPGT